VRSSSEQPGAALMITSRWKLQDEDGQSLVEYAMIVFLIALVVLGSLVLFGGGVSTMYSTIVTSF